MNASAPKTIGSNQMQPHACASGHPNALLIFSTFGPDPDRTPQILTAAMGPMGVRRVLPLVLAPSGRSGHQSGQTHAWGCCWHVWALGHAPGCTVPCRFDMPTLFGQHLGVCLWQLGFWRFFAVFGQLACCHSIPMAPGAMCPQKCVAWAARKPKAGTQGPTGGAAAWVPKH